MNYELAKESKNREDYMELCRSCHAKYDVWVAFHNSLNAVEASPLNALHMGGKEGKTPLEACVRLWLAINKKV